MVTWCLKYFSTTPFHHFTPKISHSPTTIHSCHVHLDSNNDKSLTQFLDRFLNVAIELKPFKK